MHQPKRIVIVGGVAGGASAAARARRLSEDAEIILFERGPHVSFANCGLPYHIGGEIADRARLLVQTPQSLMARFNLDVRVDTEVLAIDALAKVLTVRNRKTGQQSREPYDALVLSPGGEPLRPPIPGGTDPRILTLRNMGDMDAILAAMAGAKDALVVGGGYIGLEMAEAFRNRSLKVTLVEKMNQVMSVADPEMAAPLHEELVRQGVDLRLGICWRCFRTAPRSPAPWRSWPSACARRPPSPAARDWWWAQPAASSWTSICAPVIRTSGRWGMLWK